MDKESELETAAWAPQSQRFDYVIVGAGPAGLQLGYFLHSAGRSYVMLESEPRPGAFFEKFPRHEKLLSINKVHTGYQDRNHRLRYDWNSLICDDPTFGMTEYAEEYFPNARLYAQYLQDFAQRFQLNILTNTRVQQVERGGPQGGYLLSVAEGEQIACRVLVYAAGLWTPYVPSIPGIELTENYVDFSTNPREFIGQRVLVLGKGNSAFETANNLTSHARTIHLCSPDPVKLAWESHYVGNLRAVNNDFLDTYLLKGQNAVLDATIDKIDRVDGEYVVDITFSHANGQRARLAYDRVLVCTGFRFDTSTFASDCTPALTPCGRLPAMTAAWESTNLPDLYWAGTLMQTLDKHKTMSNVVHGFRHNIQALAAVLAERYEGEPWPCERLPLRAEALADKIIERVSTDPGMMLQPGFLGDVITVGEGAAEYNTTVSVPYIMDSRFAACDDYYVVTMEYGKTMDDILSVNRMPDPGAAHNDVYQHPRIRRYRRGELVAEHHVAESLENDWRADQHAGPRRLVLELGFPGQQDASQYQQTHRAKLVEFLRGQLAEDGATVADPTMAAAG